MKKILAVLLAVVLVATLSLSAVMLVSATSPQIVVSSVEANPGDTVDVTISLQNNPGLSSMKIKVAFPEGLTLNKPVTYDITSAGGQATQPGKVTSPATLNWVSPFEDVTGDQTFATLSFTVADDATPGDKAIEVTYNPDDVYNLAEENIPFAVTNGKITVVDNSTPPPSSDPAIVVSSATAAKGDTVDVTIALQNNPGLSSMKIKVAFPEGLTLNKPVTYDITSAGGQATQPGKVTSPATLNWVSPFEDVTGDQTFATLSFTVADDATPGDKAIEVTYNPDDVYNLAEENIPFAVTNGKITVTDGTTPCAHANTTEHPAVASTCKTAGHAAYTTCDDCGIVVSGSDEALALDPDNHEGGTEVRNAKDATCTEAGYTGDTYCLGCDAKIAEGEEIAATGHSVGEWLSDAENHWHVCGECAAELDKAAHTFDAGVEDQTNGKVTYTCTVCGYSYQEDATPSTDPTIVVSSATAAKGDTVDVTIALQNNPGLSSMKIKVAFPEGLTLNKPVTYDITSAGGQATQPGKVTSPATLNWVSPFEDVTGDQTFATLSFTVADDATPGDKAIEVTYNPDDVYNLAEENIPFAVTNGKITVTDGTTPCAHANTTEHPAVASTCKTAGHAAYTTCDDCGIVVSGSDEALALDPDNHEGDTEVRDAKDATCTEAGYTGDTYCLGCGAKIAEGETIAASGHSVGDWLSDAENHWHVCGTCQAELDKAAHTFDNGVEDSAAGKITYTCTVCGYSYQEDIAAPITDPTIIVSSADAARGDTVDITITLKNNPGVGSVKLKVTFPEGLTLNSPVTYDITSAGGQATQPGKFTSPATLNWVSPFEDVTGDQTFATLSFTVADNAKFGDMPIEVTYNPDDVYNLAEDNVTFAIVNGKITVTGAESCNHPNTTEHPAVASTCKTAGHAAYTTCDDCGIVVTGSDAELPIDPDNHEGGEEVRDAKDATCTEAGYTGDTYCLGCGAKIREGEEIAATGHSVGDWLSDAENHWHVCGTCQAEVDKAAHTFDNGVETPATCTEAGYTTFTCTECGYSYQGNEVAALGHTGGTATCHSKAVCTRCQQEYGEFDANNHDGGTEVRDAKDATCEEAGYTGDTYCLGCGAKIAEGKEVAATDHDWGDWEVTKAATYDAEGVETRVCKNNSEHVQTRAIEKLKKTEYTTDQTEGDKDDNNQAVVDKKDPKAIAYKTQIKKDKLAATNPVLVDGQPVDSSNYDIIEDAEGNATVRLKDEYLKTLGNGSHTLTVVATDGEATTTFTVKESGKTSSKTGDMDIAVMLFALIAMMGASIFAGAAYRRKNQDK